jgi:hypothetical protein
MGILKKSALGMAASALVMTSSVPAMARDYGYGGYDGYGHHHRDHDRIDGGDILTGIGILAGIAILAGAVSSSSKNRARSRQSYPETYPSQTENRSYSVNSDDVGTAVSACSQAVERRGGGQVDEIRSVSRDGNGWRVEGVVGARRNSDSFTCVSTNGQVDSIRIGENGV